MGVCGLQTFIENKTQENKEIVSLREEAKRCRRKHSAAPKLAIDGLNVISDIYQCKESIYGGEWKQFVKFMKTFVEKLQSIDIKPVFFFDGAHQESHSLQWANRRGKELEDVQLVFSNLMEGIDPDSVLLTLPPDWRTFASFVVKYECNCDVQICLEDADMMIAKFAKKTEECFGILANDTDYIIFDTKPLYLMRKLDVDSMSTEVWRRERIASKILEIDISCLPLFSCMLGNSVIQFEMLENFQKRLSRLYGSEKHRIEKVLKYIHTKVRIPIHHRNLADAIQLPETLMKEGLDSYKFQSKLKSTDEREWCKEEILSLVRQRCYKCESPSEVFNLLNNKIYKSKPVMQDPRIVPAALVYRKMRQRMYTVLFGKEEKEVRELCAYNNSDLKNPCLVPAVAINMQDGVPTLKELWNEEVESAIRWKLFLSCMGIKIPVSEVENLKPAFVTICCILNFLLQCRELNLRHYEVKAFICQAIYPCADNFHYLDELKVKTIIPRAVSIAGVFISGVGNLMSLLDVCGLPYPLEEAMPWKYFDGKLFHHCYILLKDGIMPEGVSKLRTKKELYEKLYKIATIGCHLDEE